MKCENSIVYFFGPKSMHEPMLDLTAQDVLANFDLTFFKFLLYDIYDNIYRSNYNFLFGLKKGYLRIERGH